ncbi:hypothetical protein SOQ14_07780 [Erythrobacter sp. T5W1-R]|uniref:hypothetical protein n=1 Tax=Erythrobacter sp. T5W1-R TaxID=3101752 RepID=UPI002AFEFE16|nr:hypothetical protein [Erythrobacter sp. T5W1-R]MEA1618816.1 hypothetical protein [Erythrobacter sp. T5W1-R]
MTPHSALFRPMVGGALALLVASCVGAPAAKRPVVAGTPGSAIIRMPDVMQAAGLENVIGASANSLTRRFGEPRLDVAEGDVRKLQFAGRDCVMDIYLYPLQPGGEPVATHVEARQRQGGAAVDRRQCLGEITRR